MDFYLDFKSRNEFRTRKVGGEAASVQMIREDVIKYLNTQIQVEETDVDLNMPIYN